MIAELRLETAKNVSPDFFGTAEFPHYVADLLCIMIFYPIFDFIGSKLAMKHGVDVFHPL